MPTLPRMTACVLGGVLLSLSAAPTAGARAQGTSPYETRAELRTEAQELEGRIANIEGGSDFRQYLRDRLRRIRQRLERGDFRPGDAVEVRVPGSDTLSGVFQVDTGARLRMPVIGDVDLTGVLYAEADSVLGERLSRYVRTERIRVRPLKRVAVLGAVGSPGYYDVPPSITISDLLMRAGGPTQASDLDEVEVRRDGQTVLSAKGGGLRESATLAELGVERGDQVQVPSKGTGTGFGTVMTVIGAVTSLTWAATRIF